MKRKKPGARARAKQRKADDALLRRYARHEYNATRRRVAEKNGVDLIRIKNKNGHQGAIAAGLGELVKWFKALPDPQKNLARHQMAQAIETGQAGTPESVDEEIKQRSQPHVDRLMAKAKAIAEGRPANVKATLKVGKPRKGRGAGAQHAIIDEAKDDGELDTDTELHAVESGAR